MRIYLAGPMSGHPGFNIPAFDSATAELRARGHEVVSPAEVDGETTREVLLRSTTGSHADLPASDGGWGAYLARDREILRAGKFDAIVTLPGWQRSPGANREVGICEGLGIPQVELAEVLDPLKTLETPKFEFYEDNPLRQRAVTGGVKDNRGKPRLDLLPMKPLVAVGRVLGFGAKKYKPHNWRLGLGWSDTIGSALRHVFAFADGEDIDPESGECHVDNAICQLLFLSEYFHTETGIDDRWSTLDQAAREEAKA